LEGEKTKKKESKNVRKNTRQARTRLTGHAWTTAITTIPRAEVLAALKRLPARMTAEPVTMITRVALKRARVSTIREYASTGLGAPSFLDLIKFCL
jgi:hypothetical protein